MPLSILYSCTDGSYVDRLWLLLSIVVGCFVRFLLVGQLFCNASHTVLSTISVACLIARLAQWYSISFVMKRSVVRYRERAGFALFTILLHSALSTQRPQPPQHHTTSLCQLITFTFCSQLPTIYLSACRLFYYIITSLYQLGRH